MALETIEFFNNTGGLNYKSSQVSLQDNETPDAFDCHRDELGAITKRMGYLRRDGGGITVDVVGMADFQRVDGEVVRRSVVFAFDDGTIREGDDPSSLTTFRTGQTTNTLYDFTILNNVLFGANKANAPFTWNGTAFNTIPVSFVPQVVHAHQNRVFYTNIKGFPTRFLFSRDGDGTNVPVLNFIDIMSNDGQENRNFETLYDQLIIERSGSIWALAGTDLDFDSLTFNAFLSPINSNIGITGFRASANIRNVIYFWNEEGPYVLNGRDVKDIGNKIDPITDVQANIPFRINTGSYDEIQVVDNRLRGRVLFFMGRENTAFLNSALGFDYEMTGNWDPPYRWADTFRTVGLFEDDNEDEFILGGTTDGKIEQFEQGDSDDGQAINLLYRTKWFDLGSHVYIKRPFYIHLLLRGVGSHTLRVRGYLDFNRATPGLDTTLNLSGGSIWDTAVWDTDVWDGLFNITRRVNWGVGTTNGPNWGRHLQLELSNNAANERVVIEGFAISFVREGIFGTTFANTVS